MDRKETVKPELSYETIPNEFWPKCHWCGQDLGDLTLQVNMWINSEHPKRICDHCRIIVAAIIKNDAPGLLADVLSHYANKAEVEKDTGWPRSKEVHSDEMLKLAIQNMRESQ